MIADPAFAALAGDNPNAAALLEGAYEQVSGPQMDRLLYDHAQPALFSAGQAQSLLLLSFLEDAVERWHAWQSDPRSVPDWQQWTDDEINTEVLVPLAKLLTGRQPCRVCVRTGPVDRVTRFGVEGECALHAPARQVRHELVRRVLGGVA